MTIAERTVHAYTGMDRLAQKQTIPEVFVLVQIIVNDVFVATQPKYVNSGSCLHGKHRQRVALLVSCAISWNVYSFFSDSNNFIARNFICRKNQIFHFFIKMKLLFFTYY